MGINRPNKHLKVFGVPRTGTTFIETMITINFEFGVYMPHYGNKHHEPFTQQEMKEWIEERAWLKASYLEVLENTIHPLIVIKNPYSWYQSIARFSNYNERNIKAQYSNYNYKYGAWRALLKNPYKPFGEGFVVRYEDALVNPEAIYSSIVDKTGVPMKNKGLIAGGKFFVPKKVSQSDEFTEERRKFYLSDGDFGLTPELIKWINKKIDWEIMSFYGYKKMEV